MTELRNALLRVVARAAALATHERRMMGHCAATFCSERFYRNRTANSTRYHHVPFSPITIRRFSSEGLGAVDDGRELLRASWAGCPQPKRIPCSKAYNGRTWEDEYSWMDPFPPDPQPSGNSTTSSTPTPASPSSLSRSQQQQRQQQLRRHLQREDAHTCRTLAAGGVRALQQQLLEEWRSSYLGEAGGGREAAAAAAAGAGGDAAPPERLGPYYYWTVTGADGGVEAYMRRAAPAPAPGTQHQHQQHQQPSAQSRQAAAGRSRGPAAGGPAPSPPPPRAPPPQVLLDRGLVAADARVAAQLTGLPLGEDVGAIKLCPRHRLLAYTLPVRDQHDVYCALVRDTATGRLLLPGGVVGGVAGAGGLELAADGRSLLVTRPDALGRPWQVVLHDLHCASPPRVLLTENDPRFFLALGRTKDWAFLLLSSNSKTSSEVHLLDAVTPGSVPPRLVQRRMPGLEYFVEHFAAGDSANGAGDAAGGDDGAAGRLVILSNYDPKVHRDNEESTGAAGNRVDSVGGSISCTSNSMSAGIVSNGSSTGGELHVFSAPVGTPGVAHWQPLLGPRPGVVVTDLDLFSDCCVLYERREGVPAVSVLPLAPLRLRGASGTLAAATPFEGPTAAVVPVQVPLPPWALHLVPGINADPHSPTLRLTVSSPLHPPATFDYHLSTGRLELLSQEAAPPAARELLRRCSLVRLNVMTSPRTSMYDSPSDGAGSGGGHLAGDVSGGAVHVQVPVTLVLPPGVKLVPQLRNNNNDNSNDSNGSSTFTWQLVSAGCDDGGGEAPNGYETTAAAVTSTSGGSVPRPLLLSVYGSYGLPLECGYDPTLLSLLGRGWVAAKVHVRGGGEKGRGWHVAGRRASKRAGVEDCLAAADALVAAGLTAPGLLAGHAISAGGVVLAAALNARPDLWGAAVLRCAFLELRSSCTDPRLPLTAHEWDEWGDPSDPRDCAALWEICPYGNLDASGGSGGGWRAAVLASCADEDPRVHPAIPAKWVARLRHQLRATTAAAAAGGGGNSSRMPDDDADAVTGDSDGDRDVSPWRRFLSRGIWRPRAVAARRRRGGAAGCDDDNDTSSSSSSSGGEGVPGVVAPLLRVYWDGSGHVRVGEAQAAEAAEEMAFLLRVLPSPPPPALLQSTSTPQPTPLQQARQ